MHGPRGSSSGTGYVESLPGAPHSSGDTWTTIFMGQMKNEVSQRGIYRGDPLRLLRVAEKPLNILPLHGSDSSFIDGSPWIKLPSIGGTVLNETLGEGF